MAATQRARRWIYATTAVVVLLLLIPAMRDSLRHGERARAWRNGVAVVEPVDVARMMAEGKQVVFVDVREPAEYAEFHVPGARSIPLRDLNTADPADFSGADLVIPYCLKDFRGFEGARKLRELGAPVGLMEGFGINAWKRSQLPVAGSQDRLTDREALERLSELLSDSYDAAESQP